MRGYGLTHVDQIFRSRIFDPGPGFGNWRRGAIENIWIKFHGSYLKRLHRC